MNIFVVHESKAFHYNNLNHFLMWPTCHVCLKCLPAFQEAETFLPKARTKRLFLILNEKALIGIRIVQPLLLFLLFNVVIHSIFIVEKSLKPIHNTVTKMTNSEVCKPENWSKNSICMCSFFQHCKFTNFQYYKTST